MRRFFLALVLIILIPTETFASVVLQSLLPNPLGDDTLGEYIEIRNTGCTSIDISDYRLSDASGKTYILPSGTTLASESSRKFPYSETKIALNNTGNESISLKDPNDILLDSYQYSGTQSEDVIITISFTDDSCDAQVTSSGSTGSGAGITEPPVSTGATQTGTVDSFSGSSIISSGSTVGTGEVLTGSTSSGSSMSGSGSSDIILTGSTSTGSTEESSSGTIHLSGSTSPPGDTGSMSSGSSGSVIPGVPPLSTETGVLMPISMEYSDTDGNKKIDTLEISYPYSLTGRVNTGAISLYSNTGGLSASRVNTLTGYIVSATLSGKILTLRLQEGDIEKEILKINNTTTSDLRLKSAGNLGFESVGGLIPEPFYLTSSFAEYKNIYRKSPLITLTGTGELSQSGSSMSEWSTGATLSGTLGTGSVIIVNSGVIFPLIIPTLQSPTNATLSGDVFICTTRDCRINITLESVFSSGLSMKDYACYFGSGETLVLDIDCNPNTYYYSSSGVLRIELVSKKDTGQKVMKIFSVEYLIPDSTSVSILPNNLLGKPPQILDVGKPIPIIELDNKWKEYYEQVGDYELNCYTYTCSINFTAENSYDREGSPLRYLWIYGANDISTSRDPGSRKYSFGTHEIILRVIDSVGNSDQIRYQIHVLGPKPKEKKEKKEKVKSEKTSVKKIEKQILGQVIKKKKPKKIKMQFYSSPSIILQGKSGKQTGDDTYICRYNKKASHCSMNFTLSGTLRGYQYRWHVDDTLIFIGKNPKSWKLKPGNHKIKIQTTYATGDQVIDEISFSIAVSQEPAKPKKPKSNKKQSVKKQRSAFTLVSDTYASPEHESPQDNEQKYIGFLIFSLAIASVYIFRRRKTLHPTDTHI